MNDTNILSTKFIGTVLVIVMSYVLVFVGKLPAIDWLNMATVAVGIYSASNVLNKVVQK